MTETQAKNLKITKQIVKKVVATVKPGLTEGVGEQRPGHMCVEAAICYALELPHGDDPPCVGKSVRNFKIELNDTYGWNDDKARAKGMLKVAVSQLGSNKIDQKKFLELLATKAVRQYLPVHLKTEAGEPGRSETTNTAILDSFGKARTFLDLRNAANAWQKSPIESAAVSLAYNCLHEMDFSSISDMVGNGEHRNNDCLVAVAELVNETLVEMKSPGAKWLWLAK